MERAWARRLRWRLRGAWMWPSFAVLTLAEAVSIRALPLAGERTGVVGALLLAGVLNLFAVAVLAPPLGWLVRRRRRDLPRLVAIDYAGTGLLLAAATTVLAAGLAHHPSAARAERERAMSSAAARRYVLRSAAAEYSANADRVSTHPLGPHLYRSCVPGPDPRRWLCLLVDSGRYPPVVTPDRATLSNEAYFRGGLGG